MITLLIIGIIVQILIIGLIFLGFQRYNIQVKAFDELIIKFIDINQSFYTTQNKISKTLMDGLEQLGKSIREILMFKNAINKTEDSSLKLNERLIELNKVIRDLQIVAKGISVYTNELKGTSVQQKTSLAELKKNVESSKRKKGD